LAESVAVGKFIRFRPDIVPGDFFCIFPERSWQLSKIKLSEIYKQNKI